jgi:hypothetical protein
VSILLFVLALKISVSFRSAEHLPDHVPAKKVPAKKITAGVGDVDPIKNHRIQDPANVSSTEEACASRLPGKLSHTG